MKLKYQGLAYGATCLRESIFKQRSELNRQYMLGLSSKNLLQNHYFTAGLWGPDHYPSDCHWGWESPTCQIRGDFLGHWLSAAANYSAMTKDYELKGKADWIVGEIANTLFETERNMNTYDITFLGHMCFDEITPYLGETKVVPGSAVLCGAMVAARIGKKVAVITKMAKKDEVILEPMQELGIDTFVVPAAETTYSVVIHPTVNVDERRLILQKSAGLFGQKEIPPLKTKHLHLAGISDQEFDLDLILGLKGRGYNLSADMQSFVRQVDPVTREIAFKDVRRKREIVSELSKVKLDIVEAKVLTGTDDLEKAAVMIEEWGCPEIVITHAEGVLARVGGRTCYEKFSNRSVVGRTGRGDTTFAAYLAWRMDHNVAESLKFAAALVSIKMETPGPFQGTLQDVIERVILEHSA